jgi:hypothetical protein
LIALCRSVGQTASTVIAFILTPVFVKKDGRVRSATLAFARNAPMVYAQGLNNVNVSMDTKESAVTSRLVTLLA